MNFELPERLLVVSGGGTYPEQFIAGARSAGVGHITVAAIRGMATRQTVHLADETIWFGVGELQNFMNWAEKQAIPQVALVGQITPSALFRTRFDALSRKILASLRAKHAHSIFGAVTDLLEERGMRVLPASCFMDEHLVAPAILSKRPPDEREKSDIKIGFDIALRMGGLDIGQTILIKDGMVLAVEAFEGTNEAIRRGGRLGGAGSVVIKVAKEGHDMRFDIPVIGALTLPHLRRARISAIAFQAGRTIFLDRKEFLDSADRWGMAVVAYDSGLPVAPLRPVKNGQKSGSSAQGGEPCV